MSIVSGDKELSVIQLNKQITKLVNGMSHLQIIMKMFYFIDIIFIQIVKILLSNMHHFRSESIDKLRFIEDLLMFFKYCNLLRILQKHVLINARYEFSIYFAIFYLCFVSGTSGVYCSLCSRISRLLYILYMLFMIYIINVVHLHLSI